MTTFPRWQEGAQGHIYKKYHSILNTTDIDLSCNANNDHHSLTNNKGNVGRVLENVTRRFDREARSSHASVYKNNFWRERLA